MTMKFNERVPFSAVFSLRRGLPVLAMEMCILAI